MSPILAGFLPLLVIAIPVGVAFLLWLLYAATIIAGLVRQARGEFEPDDESEDE